MNKIDTTPEMVKRAYTVAQQRIEAIRGRLDRKLTLAEKILFGHLDDPKGQVLEPSKSILALRPDRVAMQDATAQMALLQFLCLGKSQTGVPTTVHCDHLIRAQSGAESDMSEALTENQEVYDFLRTASARCGIGFWEPGAGIIHQVVLENYLFPGALIIGTDSHTPNGGGLGGLACGVGGADAVDVMAGFPWEVLYPKKIGVHLTGELNGWTSPKDVICHLCGVLTSKGGTNCIIEYFGPGARSISCTGKATITNMGAELGATTSVFPYDEAMERYLRATGREAIADVATQHAEILKADPEAEKNPSTYYDKVVEVDLSKLEPQVVGPHSPDRARSISQLGKEAKENGWPEALSAVLIGSCTNSSYEDICRATDIAKQATEKGLKMPIPFLVTPGSDQIFETIKRDGQLEALEAIGATVLANACGPCIGQWKRAGMTKGESNSIMTSFNRNFPARNDGNPQTFAFISSPEIVTSLGLSGKLNFNPLCDELEGKKGKFVLKAPQKAPDLPKEGFAQSRKGYVDPPVDDQGVEVKVAPTSERLQLLTPFLPWNGSDFEKLPLLLKAKGKCTTDHISPAGVWLRFRGHLDNISNNMFTGAINAFSGQAGKTNNLLSGEQGVDIPQVARAYKDQGSRWVVVGDDNYGEGSSREHAAMCPRHLGAAAVITKSFARIHETNLKKQGVLPFTFSDSEDYDKVQEGDRVSLIGLKDLAPQKEITAILDHQGGGEERVQLKHSLTDDQIRWFKAGSSLNTIAGGK